MKRKIILQQEETEFLEESEQYLEGYKTVITVEISFIETEDIKELKKLQDEEEELTEYTKKFKKALIKYEEASSIETEELKSINKSIKDLKKEIDSLYEELGTTNLRKVNLENEYKYETVLKIKDKEKNFLLLEQEKTEIIKRQKDQIRKKLFELNEAIEENTQLLKKNRLRQEELTEKINNVKEKTTEEIYLDLIHNTTYKVISDKEITDNGKFYAKSEHFIMLNENGDWLENDKAFRDFNSVEELTDFMSIPREKNFKTLSIQNNMRSRKYIAMVDNIPNIKEIEIIENASKAYEEQLEKTVSLKDNFVKVENAIDKKIAEYKTLEKTIQRNLNNTVNSINESVKELKESTSKKVDSIIDTMKNKISSLFKSEEKKDKKKSSFFDMFKGGKK